MRLFALLLLAVSTAHAELVSVEQFHSHYLTARQAEKRVGAPLIAQHPGCDKKLFEVGDETVEWHTGPVRYVLVNDGYESYHLFRVTEDEVYDSRTPQRVCFAGKDKGSPIGDVFFFGETAAIGTGGLPGGGAPGTVPGGRVSPSATPPVPSPSATPSATPLPTPSPTPFPVPTPSPTPPRRHSVPDVGDTATLLAVALVCLGLSAAFKR